MFDCLVRWRDRHEDNNLPSLVKILDRFRDEGLVKEASYGFLRDRRDISAGKIGVFKGNSKTGKTKFFS